MTDARVLAAHARLAAAFAAGEPESVWRPLFEAYRRCIDATKTIVDPQTKELAMEHLGGTAEQRKAR